MIKAIHLVAGEDGQRFIDFAYSLMEHNDQFNPERLRQQSCNEFERYMAQYICKTMGKEEKEVDRIQEQLHDPKLLERAKIPIRFTHARAVVQEPAVYINGAWVPSLVYDAPKATWERIIESTLKAGDEWNQNVRPLMMPAAEDPIVMMRSGGQHQPIIPPLPQQPHAQRHQ